VAARGRDLLTGEDGHGEVVAAVRIHLRADFGSGVIQELTSDPADRRLAALVGARVLSQFLGAVEGALPGETTSHSVTSCSTTCRWPS